MEKQKVINKPLLAVHDILAPLYAYAFMDDVLYKQKAKGAVYLLGVFEGSPTYNLYLKESGLSRDLLKNMEFTAETEDKIKRAYLGVRAILANEGLFPHYAVFHISLKEKLY